MPRCGQPRDPISAPVREQVHQLHLDSVSKLEPLYQPYRDPSERSRLHGPSRRPVQSACRDANIDNHLNDLNHDHDHYNFKRFNHHARQWHLNSNAIPSGMATNCNKFHLVVSGDQCGTIASNAGITLANFYAWNPAVGSTCAYLDLRDYVCIGTLTCTSASVLAAPVQYVSTCGPPGLSHDSPTSLLIASYTSGPSITSAATCGAQCIATAGCTNIISIQEANVTCTMEQAHSSRARQLATGTGMTYLAFHLGKRVAHMGFHTILRAC